MEYDVHHRIKAVLALPSASSGFSIRVGNVIDTQGFESLEYIYMFDDLNASPTDGVFNFLYEEDDDISFGSATTVPADQILGDTTTIIIDNSDFTRRVGIIGKKRFQRVTLLFTPSNAFAGTNLTVPVILGDAQVSPVAEQ